MPPASDPRQRAWARFVVAHALLNERIEEALAEAGLPPLAWYDALWTLESAEHGRLRMADLARKVILSRSNLTRLVDRLEKAKLVARADCPVDGRGTVCALTDAGRRMRSRMWPTYRKQIEALFGEHLGAREAEAMAEALQRMISSLRSKTKETAA
jgi:DNA-binding MarR family transcriptional regulator